MFWWKRYEPLLEQKAVPAKDALVDLIAKELVEMCQSFPPEERQVEWHDEHLRRRLEGRLQELPKADPAFIDEVSRLIVWDLEREFDAIDHYFRNQSYGDVCPSALHVDALQLLWRVGVEVLLTRKDDADPHLKRKDLVTAAKKLPEIFRRRYQQLQ